MNLNREILRLALPSILANVTVPLVGMVDLAVVGHLDGGDGISSAALLGGIAIGTMIFDLVYWSFSFLRSGTGGLTAQAFGRRDDPGCATILIRAMAVSAAVGIALIALQWVLFRAAFLFVQCSPQVRELAGEYFFIRIWAAPASLSLFALKGWMIGMQDSVRPMLTDLVINVVNIVFSILLGFGYLGFPALGFAGVAAGTVIAQWTGLCFALGVIIIRYRRVFHGPVFRKAIHPPFNDFFSLNGDLYLRSLGLIAVYIGFTVISARYGDMMLAVGTIMMKLLMIFSYFSDGFAYAGEALTGRFFGEGSEDGVRSTVRLTFLWGLGVAVLFIGVYWIGGTPLLRLMTSDESVISAGKAFLPWLLAMPLTGCPAFIWDGIFTGATAGKDLRNSTLLCAVGFFGAWWAGIALASPLARETTAIHILMAAYFLHLTFRAVYLTLRWPKVTAKMPGKAAIS